MSEVDAMKAVVVALLFLGIVTGCARQQMSSPAASPDRSDLSYSTQAECERAGRVWNGTSGVCM
jgi:hypothetical protein